MATRNCDGLGVLIVRGVGGRLDVHLIGVNDSTVVWRVSQLKDVNWPTAIERARDALDVLSRRVSRGMVKIRERVAE